MGAYVMAKAAPYRWRRMTSFINPFKDASNTGYQSVQGLLALSHGHVLGDGIGSSIASYGFLPNAQTDFIFAVIGEETGMVGGIFLTALFFTFAVIGVRVSCRAPSRFAALTAAGITAWLVGQAVINIGAVVGLLPVTGVPLPFVSFGGSSLVIAMFGAGILANIAKQVVTAAEPDRSQDGDERVWAVIAGGGTGGHIVPAIAIGRALVARGHPASTIRFVVSTRGMEATMVPAAGFQVSLLPGRGIARRMTFDNVGAVAGLARRPGPGGGRWSAGCARPSVVIAVGGYASVACAVAAVVLRVPLVVAEQNAAPGLANRLAGRFAAACAVSFPGTPLPRPVLTGNPVRPEMLSVDRSPRGRARARRPWASRPTAW